MVPPSRELLESLAPDQASLNAAKKLVAHKKWPLLEADESFLWGHCQGSGSTPYQVVYCLADRGYKCSCPSRKFPCKHVLALMWLRVDDEGLFESGDPPQWIAEWMGRRRPSATASPEDGETAATKSVGLAAAARPETKKPKDPAAAERARVRAAEKREAAILGGLDELDAWLVDQLDAGLLAFSGRAHKVCETISKRLYDAKAPGLAVRVASLAHQIFSWPESAAAGGRAERIAGSLGELHLIAEAYRRQASLPPGLCADVRSAVGWTTTRQDLLADPAAERVHGNWLVGCTRSEVQVDRLMRHETWLVGVSPDNLDRRAVFLDYVPVRSGTGSPVYGVGEVLTGELVFYPSAAPQRAQIVGEHGLSPRPPAADGLGEPLAAAMVRVDQERAQLPWAGTVSLWAHDLEVGFDGEGSPWLHDGTGERALPVEAPGYEELISLDGLPPFTGYVLWDGHIAVLGMALTAKGLWSPA